MDSQSPGQVIPAIDCHWESRGCDFSLPRPFTEHLRSYKRGSRTHHSLRSLLTKLGSFRKPGCGRTQVGLPRRKAKRWHRIPKTSKATNSDNSSDLKLRSINHPRNVQRGTPSMFVRLESPVGQKQQQAARVILSPDEADHKCLGNCWEGIGSRVVSWKRL